MNNKKTGQLNYCLQNEIHMKNRLYRVGSPQKKRGHLR